MTCGTTYLISFFSTAQYSVGTTQTILNTLYIRHILYLHNNLVQDDDIRNYFAVGSTLADCLNTKKSCLYLIYKFHYNLE